ncbi:MAG: phenylalanine--tRNA ligase subunit beta [Bacteroidales bacterium]|nr:phenylalanine--tRNA ligase subunit beta [Bacteroidales bacterium]
MNISYKWLKQYLTTDVTADEIAKILTSIGLEVGTVEEQETIKGGLKGLVVGHVLSCEAHENSDHLHVTTVDVGTGEPLQIVCGAKNVAAGQKVIVATIGTVLYNGDESFTIKKSKLRGVESYGMICAEDEIGVGSSHDGIMVLPDDTPVGMEAKDFFHIESDTIIEVDITPNRADAISHYGVARDLAAYFQAHHIPYTLQRPTVDNYHADSNAMPIKVTVENTDACPRYSGVTVKGVKIAPAPQWMQDYLSAIGVRPINNIVDITNYILHAFGQPLHAFDADKIKGGHVVVKNVAQDTTFVTLDGIERKLSDQDLMICNEAEPMCLAGVFGGQDSGISETTTNVFIESAYFNPVSVRKTARRHGLSTDSSFRFERGVDPNNNIYVLKYTAMLMKELAGGEIASDIVDIYPTPINDFTVNFNYRRAVSLIGKEIGKDEMKEILHALEIKIVKEEGDNLVLTVPAYRVDVQREADVVEDILRIYGFNNVEISDSLKSNISYTKTPDTTKLQNKVSEQLTACGFNEILNNSLTKISYYENNETFPLEQCVKVMNALSNDLGVMRQTLLYGGLESLAYNINRQNTNLKFYEFGNCAHFNTQYQGDNPLKAYKEEMHLALWLCGQTHAQSWALPETATTFYELRAHVDNLLATIGINPTDCKMADAGQNEVFSDAVTLTINKKTIATLGILSKKTRKMFDIDMPVYYADILWEPAITFGSKHEIRYQELCKFPEVKRDLALLIDKEVTFGEIEALAYNTERKLLKNVNLFDVYEGKNLPNGKKSYAVSFILQDFEKTLNDNTIDAVMQKLTKAFSEKLGAALR